MPAASCGFRGVCYLSLRHAPTNKRVTQVAQAVVVAHKTVGLRMLPDDGEAVGLWLAAFDIHYLNESEAGCSVQPFGPTQVV